MSRLQAGPDTFLSMEEAGLVEMAGLDMHERFLARLTVSHACHTRCSLPCHLLRGGAESHS